MVCSDWKICTNSYSVHFIDFMDNTKVCQCVFYFKGRAVTWLLSPVKTCLNMFHMSPCEKNWEKTSGINLQSDVCVGLLHRLESAMPFTSLVPGLMGHVQSVLLHVGNNTGSLPVFMTSCMAQTTGSSLDVGHGNSFCSHSRCRNVNVGTIPCC